MTLTRYLKCNVLISLIQASEIFKFYLNIISPKKIAKNHKINFENKKTKYVNFFNNFDEGLDNVNCIMTDTWFSMGDKYSDKKKKLLSNLDDLSSLKIQNNNIVEIGPIIKKAKPATSIADSSLRENFMVFKLIE